MEVGIGSAIDVDGGSLEHRRGAATQRAPIGTKARTSALVDLECIGQLMAAVVGPVSVCD